jgi:metal-sulfur cluster biosynthetic enzyme
MRSSSVSDWHSSRGYSQVKRGHSGVLSLTDMGLVRGLSLCAGTLDLRLGVTFGGCTGAPHFSEAARLALLDIPGITAVHVEIDTSFGWQPEMVRQPPPLMVGAPQASRHR